MDQPAAPQRIVVLNTKGGSGKTTVATNLAAYYAWVGRRVALTDLDPQGSSMRWLSQRPAEAPPGAGHRDPHRQPSRPGVSAAAVEPASRSAYWRA
jgi:chromosome partitioning protein